jgi:hypothetical protein
LQENGSFDLILFRCFGQFLADQFIYRLDHLLSGAIGKKKEPPMTATGVRRLALPMVGAVLFSSTAFASTITPTDATASSLYVGSYSLPASNLIGVDGLGTEVANNGVPYADPTNTNVNVLNQSAWNDGGALGMWLSNNQPINEVTVTFNLGAEYNVSGTDIWNYNQQYGAPTLIDRGVQSFTVLASSNDTNWSTIGTYTLNEAQAPFTAQNDYYSEPVQQISFSATDAQYIEFAINSDYGDSNNVGLSKVRFEATTVPEPTAFCGVLSLLPILMTRRNRRIC